MTTAMPDKTESGQPDPFSINVYALKELILREWMSGWGVRPTLPSSIRLIHFGELVDDKEQLKGRLFTRSNSVPSHLTIVCRVSIQQGKPKHRAYAHCHLTIRFRSLLRKKTAQLTSAVNTLVQQYFQIVEEGREKMLDCTLE
jgi:hypothetical protein